MKKKSLIIILLLAIIYLLLSIKYTPFIPCIFHEITGFYCPGCGITRMIISLFKLDFYQAFRYNQLLFILFPFAFILILNALGCIFNKSVPIYKKINNKIWIILIIILIIYGVVRNIYPPLMPTKI